MYLVGTDYSEGTPVPIPNTEVKLTCAEDTWLVTARDNRWRQHKYSSLAQPVEHAAVNRRVVGSSPTRGARNTTHHSMSGIFLLLSRTSDLFCYTFCVSASNYQLKTRASYDNLSGEYYLFGA